MARHRRDLLQPRRKYTPWQMQDKSSGARWMSKRDPEVAKPKYPQMQSGHRLLGMKGLLATEGVLQALSRGTAQLCAGILRGALELSLEKGFPVIKGLDS